MQEAKEDACTFKGNHKNTSQSFKVIKEMFTGLEFFLYTQCVEENS